MYFTVCRFCLIVDCLQFRIFIISGEYELLRKYPGNIKVSFSAVFIGYSRNLKYHPTALYFKFVFGATAPSGPGPPHSPGF